MGTHGRHAGTAADKDHFILGILGKEFPKGTGNGDLPPWLEIKDVRGHFPRRHRVRYARWRGGHADIQHNHPFFLGIVGHGIGPCERFGHLRLKTPEIRSVPILTVLWFNIKVLIFDGVGGTFSLDISTRSKIYGFTRRQIQNKFFDEGRHIIVRPDCAVPFLHAEDFLGHLNLHILLHGHLAGKTLSLCRFTFGDQTGFCGQDGPATLKDLHPALPTRASATAG